MLLLLVGAIVVVVALVVFWIEPLGVLGVMERLTPNIMYRVHTKLPLVALSFDDGPHPAFTPQVLEILKHHEAKATFFLIGERAFASDGEGGGETAGVRGFVFGAAFGPISLFRPAEVDLAGAGDGSDKGPIMFAAKAAHLWEGAFEYVGHVLAGHIARGEDEFADRVLFESAFFEEVVANAFV